MNAWNRRAWLQSIGAGLCGASCSGWLPALAGELAQDPRRKRQCVLLWMSGGPSQTDTFDMKPGHANGGEFQEAATAVPGLRFSEHLPGLAEQAEHLAVVRSLTTREGDHGRGTFLVRTGHQPEGAVRFPDIGALLSKELATEEPALNYVSISPYRVINQAAFSPGFLGPRYAPLTVAAADNLQPVEASAGYADLRVDDLRAPHGLSTSQFQRRLELWRTLQEGFLASHRGPAVSHHTIYESAVELMHSPVAQAFDLSQEPDEVRQAYGRGRFGQGCLMARRLLEAGVAFVEVALSGSDPLGWDTHQQNFPRVRDLSRELDQGWATLVRELADRGMLETTTFLWIGEFGRTPGINDAAGRDHFPQAWSCVFGGGGIRGGQAYGSTGVDGMEVEEDKVEIGDVLATLSSALGVSPDTENYSDQERPFRLAEGRPIAELLADA